MNASILRAMLKGDAAELSGGGGGGGRHDRRESLNSAEDGPSLEGQGLGRRRAVSDVGKDELYWEKRRRNNEAAKRSRERRRLNDIATEAKLLELSEENDFLKSQLEAIHKVMPASGRGQFIAPTISPPINNRPLFEGGLPVWPLRQGHGATGALCPPYATEAIGLTALLNRSFFLPYSGGGASQTLLGKVPSVDAGLEKSLTSAMNNYSQLMTHYLDADSVVVHSSADTTSTRGKGYECNRETLKQCLNEMSVSLTPTNERCVDDDDEEEEDPLSLAAKRLRNNSGDISSASSSDASLPTAARSLDSNYKNDTDVYSRYLERRRKNNEAAKRCRANRRALFESRFKRLQELECENVRIKSQAMKLNRELIHLRAALAERLANKGEGVDERQLKRNASADKAFPLTAFRLAEQCVDGQVNLCAVNKPQKII